MHISAVEHNTCYLVFPDPWIWIGAWSITGLYLNISTLPNVIFSPSLTHTHFSAAFQLSNNIQVSTTTSNLECRLPCLCAYHTVVMNRQGFVNFVPCSWCQDQLHHSAALVLPQDNLQNLPSWGESSHPAWNFKRITSMCHSFGGVLHHHWIP